MTDGHVWNFAPVLENLPLLVSGMGGNVLLAICAIVAGFAVGLVGGLGRYSRKIIYRWPATLFVEVFRNTPVLVQIMWFYFAFPVISPFRVSSFTAALLGLALNTGAFSAEIFRGGIQSISRGQWDAGGALGMTYLQQLRRIVLPQAVKRMVPAFTNRAIEVLKMTTLASTIAYGEILYRGKVLSFSHFNPIETYTVVALLFFTLVYPLTRVVRRFELSQKRNQSGD